jgi:hypothetical protein
MLRNKRGTKKQVPNKVSFFLNVIWEIKKGISFQYGVISPWVYIGDAGERLPVFENCCPSPSHSCHFRCHQRTIDHWSWGRIVKKIKIKRNSAIIIMKRVCSWCITFILFLILFCLQFFPGVSSRGQKLNNKTRPALFLY